LLGKLPEYFEVEILARHAGDNIADPAPGVDERARNIGSRRRPCISSLVDAL